jgi:hypothetical protein
MNAPTPLYRLRNSAEHFYTISERERDEAIANYGYLYEGIACYVLAEPVVPEPDTTALRDSVAAAICGHIVAAKSRATGQWYEPTEAARIAYAYADALLLARTK